MGDYNVPVIAEFSWQPPVEDKDLTAPPGSESKGDRYIVGGSATGDWSGEDGHVAMATQDNPSDPSHWIFATSEEGWITWVKDEDKYYTFDGAAWVVVHQAHIVQVVNTQTGATSDSGTRIPFDDTIPQNDEGSEVMTLAITPTSTTNKLKIDVVIFSSCADVYTSIALFQDATVAALAAGYRQSNSAPPGVIKFTHYMTAGTTSATTFKVRVGGSAGSTVTFNGYNSGRIFGGVTASSITITEIRV